ncbi:MAG: energy-coupling factor transporter ATPase [Bacillota bacterium]
MSLIELRGVKYRYSGQEEPALNGVDFQVEAGQFTAVIGSNGSGKSTLARLLNVLLVPAAGKVLIDGHDTSDERNMWKIRQKVGMVFQNPDNQLVATMVEDDVAFGLENLGVKGPEIRKRVDHSLAMVGMDGYQRYAPHRLSGGQKQRVAIAGIIAMEPTCIVLDEPTAMLDPRGRREVLDTVTYLNREKNITIIYITHFMEEAAAADMVTVMHGGEIINEDIPARIFSDVETLKKVNLDVPVAVELAQELRENGIDIPDILTGDELVSFLC